MHGCLQHWQQLFSGTSVTLVHRRSPTQHGRLQQMQAKLMHDCLQHWQQQLQSVVWETSVRWRSPFAEVPTQHGRLQQRAELFYHCAQDWQQLQSVSWET